MSDDQNNVYDASERFSVSRKEQDEQHLDRQRRDGRKILNRKTNSSLSQQDREKVARNLGNLIRRYGIKRSEIASTKACDQMGVNVKTLHHLILGPDEVSPNNHLRA